MLGIALTFGLAGLDVAPGSLEAAAHDVFGYVAFEDNVWLWTPVGLVIPLLICLAGSCVALWRWSVRPLGYAVAASTGSALTTFGVLLVSSGLS